MAAIAAPADQAVDLLKNLSLDSQTKTLEISEPPKKPSVVSGGNGHGQSQPFDRSTTPLIPDFMDPTVAYFPNNYASSPYYYGGYDGNNNEWDDMSHDPSLMYPGYGYGPYPPYSPAGSPVPTVGHDGSFYGAQHYHYPSPYFHSITPSSGPHSTPSVLPKGEISAPAAADQAPLSVNTANGNSNGIVNGPGVKGSNSSAPLRQTTYGSYGRGGHNAYQDPRFGFDGIRSPFPWLDSVYSSGQPRTNLNPSVTNGNGIASRSQNAHHSHLVSPRPMSGINTGTAYMNSMYPNKVYGQYGSTYRSGYGFGSNAYDSRNSARGWFTVDTKYKPRARGNGLFGYNNENADGLNELNRGPRAKSSKSQNILTPVTLAVKGQNIPLPSVDDVEKEMEKPKQCVVPDQEQYNRADFPETYEDAKFFVIKSYSEDDVHKSIKYNVWASTQNGNKKLDAAYQEAQQKPECPVFLFFSVNTSGQFVGIAEMVGPVDFNKNLEYWQQDKWIGCFPVKWHIIKDVPNTLLKHITLENNENKAITNSRDTQEVKLEQGLQMIKIFKEHASMQSILDDFEFYEERQKRIQEKKAKQQQFQRQMRDGKPSTDGKIKDSIKLEVAPPQPANAESTGVQVNGEVKLPDKITVLKPVDTPKPSPKTAFVLEKMVVANGVVNGR